jgi:hypothetical protein
VALRIIFTQHGEEMLQERRLQRSWIELTVLRPEHTEPDPNRPSVVRVFRRIPERGNRWLRVAYERRGDYAKIVTAFFDRGRR